MIEQGYIAGVLKGDGYCSNLTIGMMVKDLDFAETFANALNKVFKIEIRPTKDYRGYWHVRTSNRSRKFTYLNDYAPLDNQERAAWLRGMFDSEGNAQLIQRLEIGSNSYQRRIAMYSTNIETLNQSALYLDGFGITNTLTATKNSAGHKGTKIVYELRIRCSKDNYVKFTDLIGTSIERKRIALKAIVESYHPDIAQIRKESQLKGAQSKKLKTMRETLPRVIEGVRELIKQGVKPTQRNCRVITGYNTIQPYIPQAKLIEMALKE